jgi:protein ImuA
MALTAAARAELSRLRRDIARMEGRLADKERMLLHGRDAAPGGGPAGERDAPPGLRPRPRRGRLSLGVTPLDATLGGGLPLATLHEIRAAQSRDGGAAAGFVLALAALLAGAGGEPALVWVSEADLRRQTGRLYAPGLAALGLDPARIVEVAARTEGEALWAFEAALGCSGVGLAVCELREASLDLAATRRCALRARDHGVTGFLLRLAGHPEPSAAELRFLVRPAPAGTIGGFASGVGRMAWGLALEKNRSGPAGGRFSVEWRSHERRFAESGAESGAEPGAQSGAGHGKGNAPAHPQPLFAAPSHRQAHPPPAARRGDARRRAS